MMELVWPAAEHLASYVAALERGWSADNVRGAAAAREELAKIDADHISSSLPWSTAKQRVTQLPCRTDPLSRDSRGIAAGCGTGSSAGASAFAGSLVLPPCRPTALVMSATQ